MQSLSDKEFQLGITMSGAISAGAYTAGVIDFLIQALDEWEKARNGPEAARIPNHRVGIKVVSGASAGAITAAIGAVALADGGQSPVTFDTPGAMDGKIKCWLPKFYQSWVVKPGLVAEDGEPLDFLQTTDLATFAPAADDLSHSRVATTPAPTATAAPENGRPKVESVLNSRLLDAIAKAAIDVKSTAQPRPYIANPLHIYLTLSNLRGIPYKVPFEGGDYHMISHGDRIHYALTGLGTWHSPSLFADTDRKREIDTAWLVDGHARKPEWTSYAICALASAAFPIGLAPREVDAMIAEYDGRPDSSRCFRRFPIEDLARESTGPGASIVPDWEPATSADPIFSFRTADGGIIDNDPFEYARFSLKTRLGDPLEAKPEKANCAVIMVSPFPERRPIRPEGQPGVDLLSIYRALLPSLIDQARFKPSELVLAASPSHASRYLIGPSRVTPDGKEQTYGIASGLLGGFGGFVARAYRDHDFQLGRRNCQKFLRESFTLPSENDIIAYWPRTVQADPRFRAEEKDVGGREAYQIIPLLGSADEEVGLPEWPRISQVRFEAIQKRIAERFDVLAPALLAENVTGILRVLLVFAVRPLRLFPFPPGIGLIRKRALAFVRLAMLTDLVRRDQIEDWSPTFSTVSTEDTNAVLAALIDPAYDQRTLPGIAKAAEVGPTVAEAVLARLLDASADGKPYKAWTAPWTDKEGQALYTVEIKAPNLFDRLATITGISLDKLGLKWLGGLFPKPRTDPPGIP
jgi:hypothetical protein